MPTPDPAAFAKHSEEARDASDPLRTAADILAGLGETLTPFQRALLLIALDLANSERLRNDLLVQSIHAASRPNAAQAAFSKWWEELEALRKRQQEEEEA